jgi:enamine deaminase RidA (YjgF/YER057c/UK114 family)
VSDGREHEVVAPDGWTAAIGYSDGVVARGRTVYVAGQIGWNPVTSRFESDELVAQVEQALRNVVSVLRAAGAEPRHLVRLTWFVLDRDAYAASRVEIGRMYREFPAMSLLVVVGLLEPRALVEIEATAVIPD